MIFGICIPLALRKAEVNNSTFGTVTTAEEQKVAEISKAFLFIQIQNRYTRSLIFGIWILLGIKKNKVKISTFGMGITLTEIVSFRMAKNVVPYQLDF